MTHVSGVVQEAAVAHDRLGVLVQVQRPAVLQRADRVVSQDGKHCREPEVEGGRRGAHAAAGVGVEGAAADRQRADVADCLDRAAVFRRAVPVEGAA